ncbi:hypothetical protein NN561_012723 [Cricetulus griseus]
MSKCDDIGERQGTHRDLVSPDQQPLCSGGRGRPWRRDTGKVALKCAPISERPPGAAPRRPRPRTRDPRPFWETTPRSPTCPLTRAAKPKPRPHPAHLPTVADTPPHTRPHASSLGSPQRDPPASGPPRERATPPSLTAAALTATAFVHLEATPRQPASPEPAGATELKAGTRRSSREQNRGAPQCARPGSQPGLLGGPGGASLLGRGHVTPKATPILSVWAETRRRAVPPSKPRPVLQ